MRNLALVTLLAASLSGCYRQVIVFDAAESTGSPTVTQWRHGVIGGLFMFGNPLDASRMCGGKVTKVQTSLSVINFIVSGFTGGIYTPVTVKVWCGASKSASELGAPSGFDGDARAVSTVVMGENQASLLDSAAAE
jgi:hypothetical protein